jgi:hypothetical protein
MVIGLRIGFANLGLRVDEAGSRIDWQLSYRACMPADQPCAADIFLKLRSAHRLTRVCAQMQQFFLPSDRRSGAGQAARAWYRLEKSSRVPQITFLLNIPIAFSGEVDCRFDAENASMR